MAQGGPSSQLVTRIGEYAVSRVIGEGGMGVVYEAIERLSGRRVALKALHPTLLADDDARRRFLGEMRVMANLAHPNIVRSLATFESDGRLVLVLEHLDGHTLADELARGPLEPRRAIEIARAMASALVAAHGHAPPIVHRDLKPENVMVLGDGSLKIMDFGIAKVLSPGANKTLAHQVIGTVLYMSPEQAKAQTITPKTDLYALGLVLYEMLTGRSPFRATTVVEMLRQQCEEPPSPLPEATRAALPIGLERLLLSLLAKDPLQRPPDARSVEAALAALCPPEPWSITQHTGAGVRAPASPAPPGRGKPRLDTVALLAKLDQPRRLGWFALALVAGLLLVLAPIVAWSRLYPSKPAKTSKPRGSSEPTASAPPTSEVSCPPTVSCARFSPPDPTRVDAQVVFDEATRLARTKLPAAAVVGATFHGCVRNGAIDLSAPQVLASVELEQGGAAVLVMVERERLMLMSSTPRPGAQPIVPCPLATAWERALPSRPSFGRGALGNASLTRNPMDGEPMWITSVGVETLMLDAKTCQVRAGQR